MAILREEEGADNFSDSFIFRNEHALTTLLIQMFLLFSGGVILVGVVYVALLMLAIFFHHIIFDRDPYKVPAFIKKAPQFIHDDEMDPTTLRAEFEKGQQARNKSMVKPNAGTNEAPEAERLGHLRGPSAQKKAQIMEQFVQDLDLQRRNVAQRAE